MFFLTCEVITPCSLSPPGERSGDVRVDQHPGPHPEEDDQGERRGIPEALQHREEAAGAGAAGHHPAAQESRRGNHHRASGCWRQWIWDTFRGHWTVVFGFDGCADTTRRTGPQLTTSQRSSASPSSSPTSTSSAVCFR